MDRAYWFIETTKDDAGDLASIDTKKLRHNIDRRIVPVMLCCYIMQYIDKTLLNVRRHVISNGPNLISHMQYAAVMGLNKDLKLRGNRFSNITSLFYAVFLIAEILIGESPKYSCCPKGSSVYNYRRRKIWGVDHVLTGVTAPTPQYVGVRDPNIDGCLLFPCYDQACVLAQLTITGPTSGQYEYCLTGDLLTYDPGWFLQKVPVRRWLSYNVILCGVATACTAAAHDYHSLLAARIFIAIFEASILPSQMLITSQWFTKPE